MASMAPEPPVATIDDQNAWSIFDAAARRYLQMSGDEFLKAWDDGLFGPDPDHHRGVMDVAILIPLVR
jgi:hypothetical protein